MWNFTSITTFFNNLHVKRWANWTLSEYQWKKEFWGFTHLLGYFLFPHVVKCKGEKKVSDHHGHLKLPYRVEFSIPSLLFDGDEWRKNPSVRLESPNGVKTCLSWIWFHKIFSVRTNSLVNLVPWLTRRLVLGKSHVNQTLY